ncbi:uncharacterized protein ARMOST_15771 [Armillaria ostoyae]|uniref:Uncharacterized protein n=1 Tax=Armillaria ostoyae TaxID=47428 RepID=A0A284RUA6_ARMOS|nr:uncharacterized protein ARMOST_15771 [Armillaria ostoyae]
MLSGQHHGSRRYPARMAHKYSGFAAFQAWKSESVALIIDPTQLKHDFQRRADGLVRVQDEREAAIYQKLLALGYGPGIESSCPPDTFMFHPLVRQNRLLTEKNETVPPAFPFHHNIPCAV